MDFKNKLSLNEFEVSNASSDNVSGNYCGQNKSFDVKQMSSSLRIQIISLNKFDLGMNPTSRVLGSDTILVQSLI